MICSCYFRKDADDTFDFNFQKYYIPLSRGLALRFFESVVQYITAWL